MIRKKIVKLLRRLRRFHRWIGISLAVFLLISATTGILLSVKKDFDILQPPTQKGESKDLKTWKSLDDLELIAVREVQKIKPNSENTIDRLDVRPSKGIVKVLFKEDNLEVQLDGTTGKVLSVAPRWSDWIESLHDGSIISDLFKMISMNVLGWGLIVMIVSGFWLWYGPRRLRRKRRNNKT